MPIETICQGCGSKLRVADEFAGRKARCPKCQQVYQIPGSLPAAPSQGGAVSDPLPTERAGATSPFASSAREGAPRVSASGWYLQAGNQEYGPVSKAELDRWVAEGRVTAEHKVRQDDQFWQDADKVFPFLGNSAPAPTQNPFAYESPANNLGSNPYASTANTGAYRNLAAHRGGLILAFGVLGLLFCVVFGIVSWVMGRSDLREMRAGRMDPSGMGLTQAGMSLGIVTCCLQGAVLVLYFGILIVALVAAAAGQ